MFFKRLPDGMLGSNCYITGANGECVVIDPGVDASKILQAIEENRLHVKYIVATHAHLDHIVAFDDLKKETGAVTIAHKIEAKAFGDSMQNGAALFGLDKIFSEPDIKAEDGYVFECGGITYKIIHTPGHTEGSICILIDSILFSGDTLFYMSVGRTDLGRGSQEDLIFSIKHKLFKLDPSVKVYPGHGTATTIGFEKENNPFV